MTFDPDDDLNAKNDESLRMLVRSLTLSQGQFSLILARCNYTSLRQHLMQQLRERCSLEFRERVLDPSAKTIEETIQEELGDQPPPAVIISGLESVQDLDAVLIATNQARDEFRRNFPFPLVLWGTDQVLRRLIRVAPDFESWAATPIEFEIATDKLIYFIEQITDQVFVKVLEIGASVFINNAAFNLGAGSPLRIELESARHNLQSRGVRLDSELEASLEFVLGRDVDSAAEESRQHLERSLALWQTSSNLERRGCVLYSLGLWWRTYATRHRDESKQASSQEKDCFQQCVEVFEQANRQDLVAKFVNPLGAILQELQQWDELEWVAEKALILHQTYPDSFRLARAYGFLAEVALSKSAWTDAKQLAEQALSILANAESTASNVSSEQNAHLEWVRSYHQGWHQGCYLFALARSLSSLGQQQKAIATLEAAIAQTKPYYDPELYIRILGELRSLYFEQGEYLKAFEIKQDQRSIEQQYGFRAFVGAGRLQPKQQVINPVLALVEGQRTLTQEITASGRQQDVNRLVERISRNDHKLTVIQGQSGVGKSSILQAGLIPALKQRAIGTRRVVPVLQQVYPDWIRVLGQCLAEALVERGILASHLTPQPPDQGSVSPQGQWESNSSLLVGEGLGERSILEQLQNNADNNLLTVLLFDQFEEFFFVYKEPFQRLAFYDFFRKCLDIPYVKVILSLREDYLYYLLECNNRLISLDVINNNILDKNILYYLGNFSVQDAKSVIQSLTEQSQFSLEPALIDALVQDLAGELQEVRPIEMQVVGSQLQTEKITTLEQYLEHGPKEKLVGRFLEEVVKDCGSGNEQIAKLVLYLLTDENNTRPLKTRADLELELDVPSEKLDLVLEVFVKSRLVFQVPALPVDRYQLVHDYLVSFVRQQQSARLIAELDKEREQRKLTEAKLNQVLKQQLQSTRRAAITLVGLLLMISGVAAGATITGINLYITNLSSSSEQKSELDLVVSRIKAGKRLKQLSLGAIPGTQIVAKAKLNQAIYTAKEINRLEGFNSSVTSVSFSPNGKILATVSEDKIVKVWRSDGFSLGTLKGHRGKVTSVSFSPDGKVIATASEDKTVKLWNRDGSLLKFLKTLEGHTGKVTSVSFSPKDQMLASASEDKTVKLWNRDGSLLKTLKGHTGKVTSVSFNSDGKILASADEDDKVKLWNYDGRLINTIDNYGTNSIKFSSDHKSLILVNKDNSIKLYDFSGTLIKNISPIQIQSGSYIKTSFSPDGKLMASVYRYLDKSVTVRTVEGYRELEISGHSDSITDISFSPDSKVLATASKDKTVKLWRLDRKAFKLAGENKNDIKKVKFSFDSQTIAAANNKNTVQLWNKKGALPISFPGDGSSVMSFSPDNQYIVTGSPDDVVKVWSLDGREIALRGHTNRVTSISFSPNGKTIASASDDNTVRLWRTDGTLIKKLEHEGSVTSVTFSPDGKVIASIGDNVVKLWKSDGISIRTLTGHTKSIESLRFSPDSKMITTIGDDNVVKLWKSDGTFIRTLTGHTHQVSSVSFSLNSQIIASVSKGDKGLNPGENSAIQLWQRDGKRLKKIDDYGIKSIRFSPANNIIASINKDNCVKLWNFDGKLLKTFKEHHDEVIDVSFSPDGKTIASASADNTVKLWRRDSGIVQTLKHSSKVNSVSFSPDGETLVSASADNMVKLWNREGKELKTFQKPTEGIDTSYSFSNVNFSGDGKLITFVSNVYSSSQGGFNYIVKLWNLEGKELQARKGRRNDAIISIEDQKIVAFKSFNFSPNGRAFALAVKDNALKLWNRDGTLLKTLPHDDKVNSVIFSPDNKTIASGSDDKTVKLWNRDGTLFKILKHNDKVNSVSFSPDNKTIASASDDKTVKLWNRKGTLLNTLKHSNKVNSVTFSSDDKTIASASDDKTIKLWNRDGTMFNTLSNKSKVKSVSFSPNGKTIASVSDDNTINLWSSNDGKKIKTIQGSDNSTTRFSFSPDSKTLIVFRSGSLTLHLINGLWFQETQLADINPTDLSFSPDGKALATANDDGVSVLSLDLDELLGQGCDWVRDYLNNNPNDSESDRPLCDGIGTQK